MLLCLSYLAPPSPAPSSSQSWPLPSSLCQWWVTIPVLPSYLHVPNTLSSSSCSRWSTQGRWTLPAHRWGCWTTEQWINSFGVTVWATVLCVPLLARVICKWLLKQSPFLLCSLIVLHTEPGAWVGGGHLLKDQMAPESSMILPLASSCLCTHASQYPSWPFLPLHITF